MINDRQCDTAEPQNLNDYDFDQDTRILPPLTAAIILCFLAQHDLESLISESSGHVKDEIVTALKTAHIIWIRSSTSSVEARVAANALRIVLGKMMPQEELDGSSIAPDQSGMDEEMPFNPS